MCCTTQKEKDFINIPSKLIKMNKSCETNSVLNDYGTCAKVIRLKMKLVYLHLLSILYIF